MLNKEIILSNIKEARRELEKLEKEIASNLQFSQTDFEMALRHAYHHINFSWHIRSIDIQRYKRLSDDDFAEWSKFPEGFDS